MARGEPKTLESLLPRVLARLAGESGRASSLMPLWTAAVGENIARHSRPHQLDGSTLIISVESAEWAQVLSRQADSLLERLNEKLGAGTVKSLAFQLESR
ncbi:DciA family protein [Corallococcus sp. RDP092CA]|uniref:DciA family protein n=1 Tax=Corallococcus sp. RDP092CA TaxID=3109369 RepID=UPI0035B24C0A